MREYAAAKKHFAKAARLMRRCGSLAFGAKALRCVARMAIRMDGEAAIHEMESAKEAFLELGMAGEVCRSSIAVMEELVAMNPQADLTCHSQELEGEAAALGVLPISGPAIRRLKEAARNGCVTEAILQDAWEAFGKLTGFGAMSAVATVQN